jgi:integrase
MYRDASGKQRSAGTFASKPAARRAAEAAEDAVRLGTWVDPRKGDLTFDEYVDDRWLPLMTVMTEVSTLAGYRSYLRAHFRPAFDGLKMRQITQALVQGWVVANVRKGKPGPTSIAKYHTMLHGLFRQAVADGVIGVNPCAETVLPKVPSAKARAAKRRVITPADFDRFVAELPEQWRDLAEADIETGMRWGELIAQRPRTLDVEECAFRVEQVIVEVSKADSPTGERFVLKELPKDDEPRTLAISHGLVARLVARAERLGLGPDDLFFSTSVGTPLARGPFRKRVIVPAARAAGLSGVTIRELRHAHASWSLAGGATLVEVQAQLGHSSLSTTQLYVHALAGAQTQALNAMQRVRASGEVPRLPAA